MKNTYKLLIVLTAILLMCLLATRIHLPVNPQEFGLQPAAPSSQESITQGL